MINEVGTLLFLLLAIGFVVGANEFTGKGAEFPLLVGYATTGLIILEILAKVFGFFLKREKAMTDVGSVNARLFSAFVFLFGIIACIYAFGVTFGSVLGVSLYYLIHVKMSLWLGVSLGAATAFSAWLIFEKLAGFSLFSGAVI
tara:strand:- start:1304 stop:1735 length:432 start_codon:yes stop_codon:yes gene_type:complete